MRAAKECRPDDEDQRNGGEEPVGELGVGVLGEIGLRAESRSQGPEIGVWAEGRKIASLGVHVSRWITTHGFALNVSTDLGYFSAIVPCGLREVEMTSVADLTGRTVLLEEVASASARHFSEVFQRRLVAVEPARLS